MIIDNVIKKRG